MTSGLGDMLALPCEQASLIHSMTKSMCMAKVCMTVACLMMLKLWHPTGICFQRSMCCVCCCMLLPRPMIRAMCHSCFPVQLPFILPPKCMPLCPSRPLCPDFCAGQAQNGRQMLLCSSQPTSQADEFATRPFLSNLTNAGVASQPTVS